MEHSSVSFCILSLYKEFAAYTTERLQELGLSFGLMYFIIYVGKHPCCTPSDVTANLAMDWGHSQRSLNKLVDGEFLTKEKTGRSYCLNLTPKGENAFIACHEVFTDWDAMRLDGLNPDEQQALLRLLHKVLQKK